jgi:succinyl-diaminopimelate desuccinylase
MIYGRGTSDMKGGVAAIIVAATRLAAGPRRAAGTTILLTADEETGARGARALAAEPEVAALGALVVAEPTDNEVRVGHRGALWLALHAHGRAAHASTPEAGENALTRMRAALDGIEAAEIAGGPPHPLLGVSTLAITGLRAGAAVNVIPDRAEATIDIRANSASSARDLTARVRDAAGADIGLDVLVDVPALRGDLRGRLAKALRSAGARRALTPTVPFFTDAGVLQRPGLEVAIVGPGSPGLAHQVDEWCSVEQLNQAVDLFEAVALSWNGKGD